MQARGRVHAPDTPEIAPTRDGGAGSRPVYWREYGEFRATDVYDGPALGHGTEITGPAIIDYPVTTVVLPPGSFGAVDRLGNIVIDVGRRLPAALRRRRAWSRRPRAADGGSRGEQRAATRPRPADGA